MKAVVVTPGKKDTVRVEEVANPDPQAGSVLVKVLQVGVDGTDFEINDGLYGEAPKGEEYLILGHESFGVVEETGSSVKTIKRGDFVVSSVRRPCPHNWCGPCRNDQNDMCITGDYAERGIKLAHGFLAEYYVEQEHWLTRVGPEARAVGVFVEPLTVVEKVIRHAFEIQKRVPWQVNNALILGAGTIGLLAMLLLRLRGIATSVYDRSGEESLKAAIIRSVGATYLDAKSMSLTQFAGSGKRPEFVLDATGFAPLIIEATQVLAQNGVLALVGISAGKKELTVDVNKLNLEFVLGNRVMFGSVNAGLVDFRNASEHLTQILQKWPKALDTMITRRIPITEFKKAFDGEKGHVKTLIDISSVS